MNYLNKNNLSTVLDPDSNYGKINVIDRLSEKTVIENFSMSQTN